jgi:hypothetical protein
VEISEDSSSKIFNVAALTLAILVCIYEVPSILRREFIDTISARQEADAHPWVQRRRAVDAVSEPGCHQLDRGVLPVRWLAGVPYPAAVLSYAVAGPGVLPCCGHGHGAAFTSEQR